MMHVNDNNGIVGGGKWQHQQLNMSMPGKDDDNEQQTMIDSDDDNDDWSTVMMMIDWLMVMIWW